MDSWIGSSPSGSFGRLGFGRKVLDFCVLGFFLVWFRFRWDFPSITRLSPSPVLNSRQWFFSALKNTLNATFSPHLRILSGRHGSLLLSTYVSCAGALRLLLFFLLSPSIILSCATQLTVPYLRLPCIYSPIYSFLELVIFFNSLPISHLFPFIHNALPPPASSVWSYRILFFFICQHS